jgi:hypothetical protein
MRYAALAALAVPALAASPRLVLISLDGCRADAVTPDVAPNLTALEAAGAHARQALDDLPPVTTTNHATMLTGLTASEHHIVIDADLPGVVPFKTLFDYAHDAGLRCAFFAGKVKLRYFAPPEALETIDIDSDQAALLERVLVQLAPDGPDVIFVHFHDPDSTGHRSGWMSPEYLAALTQVDAYVGQIAGALAADAGRGSYLIVTADHGGEGPTHILNDAATREIPWIVTGPGIPAGAELTDTVAIADTTPTALWLLGLDVPAGLSGRVRSDVKGTPAADLEPLPVAPLGPPCAIFVLPVMLGLAWAARRQRGLRKWGPRAARGPGDLNGVERCHSERSEESRQERG